MAEPEHAHSDDRPAAEARSTAPAVPAAIRELLPAALSRLAAGLPRHELDLIIKEATACEDALEREIATLEAELGLPTPPLRAPPSAPLSPLQEPTMISLPRLPLPYQPGKGPVNYLSSVDAMLSTEFTPPDRYFTVSALLGRLRAPLALPLPPRGRAAAAAGVDADGGERARDQQAALADLDSDPAYIREQEGTAALLALYKKIASHRTAAVFRKPVNPAEAPGYKERILFPMDLSLVRKMIVARMLTSFAAVHQRVGLICHNCVKFNGRESDYAVLTREFEDHVDDKVLEAVRGATARGVTPPPAPVPSAGAPAAVL